jgi:hypothetical protein
MTRSEVWRASGEGIVRVPPSSMMLESKLESWIEAEPGIRGALLIIGRQVTTRNGGRLDLLAMDILGDLHVIELKRDRASSLVVSQVLSYGAWVQPLSKDEVRRVFRRYRPDVSLEAVFRECFSAEMPDKINAAQHYAIVAVEVDQATEDSVQVLAAEGVRIKLVLFEHFEDRGADYFVRLTLARSPQRKRGRLKAEFVEERERRKAPKIAGSSTRRTPLTGSDPTESPQRLCSNEAHPHTGESCSWSRSEATAGAARVIAVVKKPETTVGSFDDQIEQFWLWFSPQFQRDHYAYDWLYSLYSDWAKSGGDQAPLIHMVFVRRLKPIATASGHWVDNRARPAALTRAHEPLMDRFPDTLPSKCNAARHGLRRVRKAFNS